MFLAVQRVTRGARQGVNAFLYWHGRDVSGEDPRVLLDAPAGTLQLRVIELAPGGNAVRSFLDIALPDQSTRAHIESVLDLVGSAATPDRVPVVHRFGDAAARLCMDQALAAVWRDEVSELVGVARACVLSFPGLRVTPRYAREPGELEQGERRLCSDAAARKDTEAVLALMRQLARARRLGAVGEAIRVYADGRGDERVRVFLADHVAGIFSNHLVPTFGSEVYERFVEWGLANPRWGDALRAAALAEDDAALDDAGRRMIPR